MKGGKDVRERNIVNKEKEGLEEGGNEKGRKLGKEIEYNIIEGKGRGVR